MLAYQTVTMPGRMAQSVPILDIRRDKAEKSLQETVLDGLNPRNGDSKSLPSLLLYDGTMVPVEEATY